jgi:hypothetical protein
MARLSADTTMFHTLAVSLALLATDAADLRACLENRSRQGYIKFSLAGKHLSSSATDIGTVEIKGDAAKQRLALLFSKIGIRTGRTRLHTIKAGFNALLQQRAVYLWLSGTALHH